MFTHKKIYWIKCRGLMRNMHAAALLGEADQRQTNKTSETTMSNAKKPWAEGKTVNEREEWTFFCMQGENRGEGVMMENSWTARPTCDRVLYYYGDFSGALCFAPTVKTEQRENTEGKLSHAEGKQWAERTVVFQRLTSFRLLQSAHCAKRK